MNKQAYLKMMNGGLSKRASVQQQQLLYKLAMMHKLLNIRQWWDNGGSGIRNIWLKFLLWLKKLFGYNKTNRITNNNLKKSMPFLPLIKEATQGMVKATSGALRTLYSKIRDYFLDWRSDVSNGKYKYETRDPLMTKIDGPLAIFTKTMLNAKTPAERHAAFLLRRKWLAVKQQFKKVRLLAKKGANRFFLNVEKVKNPLYDFAKDIKLKFVQKPNGMQYKSGLTLLLIADKKRQLSDITTKMTTNRKAKELALLFNMRKALLGELYLPTTKYEFKPIQVDK